MPALMLRLRRYARRYATPADTGAAAIIYAMPLFVYADSHTLLYARATRHVLMAAFSLACATMLLMPYAATMPLCPLAMMFFYDASRMPPPLDENIFRGLCHALCWR